MSDQNNFEAARRASGDNCSRDDLKRPLQTRSSLAAGLRACGISRGDVICAHVSLSSLGYVCGAGQTVIAALGDAVGLDGSIMMPAFSGEMSDPATWLHPPVPPDWIEIIRRETPIYDPRLTPTRLMGTVAELFRTYPGVRRSSHPHSSFAACGRYADVIAGTHPLDFRFGSASPLGKLAALDGKVLLLGADTRRGSFIYLAQYLSGLGARGTKVVPVADGSGGVMWRTCHDVIYSNRYVQTGIEFLMAEGVARVSAVGDAPTVLMPVRESLAALLDWGWKTADVPHEVLREPVPLPARWEEWLQTESLGDA